MLHTEIFHSISFIRTPVVSFTLVEPSGKVRGSVTRERDRRGLIYVNQEHPGSSFEPHKRSGAGVSRDLGHKGRSGPSPSSRYAGTGEGLTRVLVIEKLCDQNLYWPTSPTGSGGDPD